MLRIITGLFLCLTLTIGAASASERPAVGPGPGEFDLSQFDVTSTASEFAAALCPLLPPVCNNVMMTTVAASAKQLAGPIISKMLDTYLVSVPGVEVDGSAFYNVVLSIQLDAQDKPVFTLVSLTQTDTPDVIGGDFSTQTGIAYIPEIVLLDGDNVAGAYELELQVTPGSDPLSLFVRYISPL